MNWQGNVEISGISTGDKRYEVDTLHTQHPSCTHNAHIFTNFFIYLVVVPYSSAYMCVCILLLCMYANSFDISMYAYVCMHVCMYVY